MRNDANLEDRCFYYTQSRTQRANELGRGQGLKGTEGYKNQGCFKCSGYNFKCQMYLSNKESEGGERK